MGRKNAFTMVEILMIIVIMWMWILTIIVAAQRMMASNERVVQNVVANHLAVQWLELLYGVDDLWNYTWESYFDPNLALTDNSEYSSICLMSWKYLPCLTWDVKFYRVISWSVVDVRDDSWMSVEMYKFCSIVKYFPVLKDEMSEVQLCMLFKK